jgi:hypothetical protein
MTIELEDNATPRLRGMLAALRRRKPLLERMGKAVEVRLREHFAARNTEGNAKGWPKRNFWNRVVRKATAFESATEEEASVAIASREFAQKLYGGTIRAQRGKYLAIPLTARAYRTGRPGLWSGAGLSLVKTPKAALLVENLHSSLGRKGGGGRIRGGEAQYLLVKSVTQAPDPRALPSSTKLTNAALMVARTYVEALQRA